ncbi:elongation factor Ts [Acetobacteraceae bacterium]|nr:elongation factor Ts [Acetobacteraceae bacterium]
MAAISAQLVRDLRERTGAGMMDCKKALSESNGNIDEAIDWLRTKGLSQAAKKSGRAAAEGLVAIASNGTRGAMVEINAETDFVARNESFQNFVEQVAQAALEVGEDLDAISKAKLASGRTVADELTHLVATIGENMVLRRAKVIEVSTGAVASYIHGALKPGVGRIGVLVGLEGASEASVIEDLGRRVGMHVAAARPVSLCIEDLDPKALEHERSVLSEQARASGKPEAIIEKMVDGRVRKFYEEVVLLEQIWVHDGESKVNKVLSKENISLKAFERFQLGEGVEKAEDDFAAEVAKAAGQ